MTINTAYDFDQLPADEQSRLFGAWTPQTICRLLTTAAPDSTLRTMADEAGWDGLTPPPHPQGWEWDVERRMHIDPAPSPAPEPPPPLSQRLLMLNADSPVQLRAALAPLQAGVKSLLDIGDLEAAREVIATAQIPAEFEARRQEMLAEFDK